MGKLHARSTGGDTADGGPTLPGCGTNVRSVPVPHPCRLHAAMPIVACMRALHACPGWYYYSFNCPMCMRKQLNAKVPLETGSPKLSDI